MEQENLYVYWDADNISVAFIPRVREFFAARNQTPKVCRAFGCCLSKKQVAFLACIMHERVSDELLRGKGGSLAG
jgi:hypothetical protein